MPVPNNFLVNVETYQNAELAYLQNLACFIATSNKKFENFTSIKANLGATVLFAKPPRMTTTNSLVASFQPADQRFQELTIDQQISSSVAFTDQQVIENVRDYMNLFGRPAVAEIGTVIEANIAMNCLTNTYRFYNATAAALTTYTQLAEALAQFRNYGSANNNCKGYISDIAVPSIIGGSLGQFVLNRNEKAANSWELGSFSNCEWYQSNLLPVHIAGAVGSQANNADRVMTVSGMTFAGPGNSIDTITFTTTAATVANTVNAIKKYDRIEFNDVTGQPLLRYLTWTGHKVSANKVQIQSLGDADSNGTRNVTVTINPPLQVLPTNAQNINTNIAIGMTATVSPSHRSGLITSGNPLFLAMPQLPGTSPYTYANQVDQETGVSMRMYYGHGFGDNTNGLIHDAIWGSTMAQEYAMAILLPL